MRLKPAGIEWLDNVPEHWGIRKLGHLARVFNGTAPSRMQPKYWQSGTIPWLSSGKVNDGIVNAPSELISELAFRECSLSLVPQGSVILGMVGQAKTRGTCALLNIGACINENVAAIVPLKDLEGRFLRYMLRAFYKPIRESGRGGNQEALNCEIVSSLRLPMPSLAEQVAIANYLDRELYELDGVQARAQRKVDFIREYRMRLIADVVTGKLDVREAAAKLPEEADEAEPLEEVEEPREGIEEEVDLDPEVEEAAA